MDRVPGSSFHPVIPDSRKASWARCQSVNNLLRRGGSSIETFGVTPRIWNDLLRIQASIRKKRKEEAERKRRELEQMIKWGFGGFVFLGVAILIIIVGLKYYGF